MLKKEWQMMGAATGIAVTLLSLITMGPAAFAVVEPVLPATHIFVRDAIQNIQVAMSQQSATEHDSTVLQLTKLEKLINITNLNALNTSLAVMQGQVAALNALAPNAAVQGQIDDLNNRIESTKRMISTAECDLATSGQSDQPCK